MKILTIILICVFATACTTTHTVPEKPFIITSKYLYHRSLSDSSEVLCKYDYITANGLEFSFYDKYTKYSIGDEIGSVTDTTKMKRKY